MPSNDEQIEIRTQKAIEDFKNGKITSIRQLAILYDVPRIRIARRLHGIQSQQTTPSKLRRLDKSEEESLTKWIISMDNRGLPPQPRLVEEMANVLLRNRPKATTESIGHNWVSRYIKRTPEIQSKFNRKYDYVRAKCEDKRILESWFKRLQSTIEEYGITADDIYNFDETGFAMGLISSARVVTQSNKPGNAIHIQPGNKEWVTTIECIGATGKILPSCIIFKGKIHAGAWYEEPKLEKGWRIEISENGWTNNVIGLRWLRQTFIPFVKQYMVGTNALLIMDGHGSHLTAEFDDICRQNSIITICLPPHSSHILQPLDVCCFKSLKQIYGDFIRDQTRLGARAVNKLDFLEAYCTSRKQVFTTSLIQKAFEATGIIPYEPKRVYSKLSIQLSTPSPPSSQNSDSTRSSTFQTPHNIRSLKKKASSIRKLLKNGSKSPPTPSKKAVEQLIKGCKMALQGGILLAKENEDLRITLGQKHQKTSRSRKRFTIDEGLSVEDGLRLLESGFTNDEAAITAQLHTTNISSLDIKPRQRAPARCSICHNLGHKKNKCTNT